MTAYYNENDPKAAAWLRELIKKGLIAPGDVDERSIEDILPSDLDGYTQCHFFAGIGGWSYALRLAGWPDDKPVWTGSCPCQPFSAAGKGGGFADERHVWPAWFHLIEQHRPSVVFGEQVASKDGLNWFDLVQADLEGAGYSVGAADLSAAGVGAPHVRQRLYFVADSARQQQQHRRGDTRRGGREFTDGSWVGHAESSDRRLPVRGRGSQQESLEPVWTGSAGVVGVAHDEGSQGRSERGYGADERIARAASMDVELAYADGRDASAQRQQRSGQHGFISQDGEAGERAPQTSAWSACDTIPCTDGKARPVEPGTFPLAHGIPGRVGLLRGYGNAIVAPQAAEFISAYQDSLVDEQ